MWKEAAWITFLEGETAGLPDCPSRQVVSLSCGKIPDMFSRRDHVMNKARNSIVLALAVILLELIGGMQAYLGQLILPIMASDLGAQNAYGIIMGVSTITAMVGLPIGAALLKRFTLSKLLLVLTVVLAIGAVISATAAHIAIYLIGTAIRGISGSALAMTSIGAVALGLTGRARQLTLAFSSASWVVSSVVGPAYAAWVTHLLSWRWAMLLYLPLLVVARVVVALNLNVEKEEQDSPFPFQAIVLITTGVALTIIPFTGYAKIFVLLLGMVVLARVAKLLMPSGTLTDKKPRKMALGGMFFLTAAYFSANELIGLTGHDVFSAGADDLGLILMGGGLGWAVMGVWCGFRPANTQRRYALRSAMGLLAIASASLTIGLWVVLDISISQPIWVLVILWTIAGVGMGITYLDTLNIFFEDPDIDDGISIEEIAGASVIVESLSSTMFIPFMASIVALAFSDDDSFSAAPYGITWLMCVVLAGAAWLYLRNAEPASAKAS